ncbi:D-glycero-beta-D-manno-heptose-7-phosphate kinase [Candidatus Thioglobus sp.]|nr:D-glycero-beta-D-manno-heptose-7-phosphate kinase [Candidatus Thioglobus sp.]
MIELQGKSPKILVVGDLMIDHYLWGKCERISPEAPVQVINIENESISLGGAGNVINNLQSLGASVDILSIIGDSKASNELVGLIKDIKIKTNFLISQKNRKTSKKSRIIASHQQVVRFDRESTEDIDIDSQTSILRTFKKIINSYQIILLSDYGKGIFTKTLTQSLIKVAKNNGKKVLIDPKGADYNKYKGAYLLTPNKKEASEATKININNNEDLVQAITILKRDYNLDTSLITLSEDGIAVFDNNFRIHPTNTRQVFDVTGAGDTVLASLGFALACELDIDRAIKFSNLAASVVVNKIGSATATLNEIIELESSLNKSSSAEHIKTLDEIKIISADLKERGKKIVFTNGCFDLLHAGHVKYLETAKSFGDILILGLNSDRSVRAIKGPKRPINNETDRAYIVAALEVVDYVIIFDEDTPYNLIKTIKPQALVKGKDYEGKKVSGQDIVDELILVDLIRGKSSTQIIKKIKEGN